MTTTRAKTCASCAFPTDHMLHYRNCVPTSQWPRELRERKAAAMGHEVPVDIDREPERTKPNGLAEYRRLHPEANPLTTENITVREFRKREDGGTDEWDRVVGVREAMNKVGPCPRCSRPMLDRLMHITCQPVDGSVIPDPDRRDPLKRDDVPLTPRTPVVHTTADVRGGAGWWESLPQAEEPEPDEDEMADFLAAAQDALTRAEPVDGYPDAGIVHPDSDVLERVMAEQKTWVRPSVGGIDIAVSGGASAPASSVLADEQALERSQPSEAACECGWQGKDIAKHRARAKAHREVTS